MAIINPDKMGITYIKVFALLIIAIIVVYAIVYLL